MALNREEFSRSHFHSVPLECLALVSLRSFDEGDGWDFSFVMTKQSRQRIESDVVSHSFGCGSVTRNGGE